MLAKQALYRFSHTFSPFCFGYFGDEDFTNCLPGLGLNLDPLDLSLPSSWDYRLWAHPSFLNHFFEIESYIIKFTLVKCMQLSTVLVCSQSCTPLPLSNSMIYAFCVCLLSLCMMFSRFSHIIVWIRTSFLFFFFLWCWELNSMLCRLYH
jgi:hypothetical protein